MSKSSSRRARDQQKAHKPPASATPARTENPPPSTESPGGSGEPYALPGKGVKNDRLERRAIRSRWQIKEEYRTPMLNRQIQIAMDPNSEAKEATAAFKAVLSADAANMEQEKRDSCGEKHLHEIRGELTVTERREFFVKLGETLAAFPEAKERVAGLLEEQIKANEAKQE